MGHPGPVDWRRRLAIALGGVAGAGLRWLVLTTTGTGGTFPWPVLALNVAGSTVLGMLLAEEVDHERARLWLHDVGGIGFCGGLTTFSTFTVEVVALSRDGDAGTAIAYGVLSVGLAIAGVLAGAAAFRHVRAAGLPLEEQP